MIFNINPVPKPRMTRQDTWKQRPCVVKYWQFKDEIQKQMEKKGFELEDDYCVIFKIPVPKSLSKKKQEKLLNKLVHKKRPDLDNLEKALNDCMKEEDSTIWCTCKMKLWAEEYSIEFMNDEKFFNLKKQIKENLK